MKICINYCFGLGGWSLLIGTFDCLAVLKLARKHGWVRYACTLVACLNDPYCYIAVSNL